MKITTKLFLKSFILYFILFGILMTIVEYFLEEQINFLKQIIQSLIFSGIMSAVFVNIKIQSSNKIGNDPLTKEDLKITYSDVIETNLSLEGILKVMETKSYKDRFKLELKNSKIVGKTSMSLFSWGERITISNFNNKIKIESKPVLRVIPFNNDQNKKNVKLIKELIES
jgi:vacuolar-type H+-ATPase subunit I/STV1